MIVSVAGLPDNQAAMPFDPSQQQEERLTLNRCMEGDPEALGFLRNKHQAALLNNLVGRGATPTEAEDLLADLWGDCVGNSNGHPSLLEKYSGKCPLRNWLMTVATRRLIDLKRKAKPLPDTPAPGSEGGTTIIQRAPAPALEQAEGQLIDLLRFALQEAFATCPSEPLLMLRLVYLHGLSQRELARMWGCHEATISRCLAQAMSRIKKDTMREVKKRDPWFELTWEDLIQLCETQDIGFL